MNLRSVIRLGKISPIWLFFEVFGEFFDKKIAQLLGYFLGEYFAAIYFVENCDIWSLLQHKSVV